MPKYTHSLDYSDKYDYKACNSIDYTPRFSPATLSLDHCYIMIYCGLLLSNDRIVNNDYTINLLELSIRDLDKARCCLKIKDKLICEYPAKRGVVRCFMVISCFILYLLHKVQCELMRD